MTPATLALFRGRAFRLGSNEGLELAGALVQFSAEFVIGHTKYPGCYVCWGLCFRDSGPRVLSDSKDCGLKIPGERRLRF